MFDNLPLWPARASTTAGSVDALYIFLVALSLFVSVAIFTMICIFALRYRQRKGREAEQVEGSTILELTWSAIPLAIFLFIFAWAQLFISKNAHLREEPHRFMSSLNNGCGSCSTNKVSARSTSWTCLSAAMSR